MLKYLKKYRLWCLLAPLFMLGEIAMDLIQPDLMAQIVDRGVLKGNLSIVINTGIRMIGFVIFGGFCGIMSGVFANFAAQKFGNDLRKDAFRKIMNLSFEQTDKFSTGSLVTRLTNDVTQVQNLVMMSVRSFVRCSVMFAGGIFMLYLQSPRFASVASCALPLIVFFIFFFMKKASPLFSVVQQKIDNINNIIHENIAGARVVKAYVNEGYELNRFDAANSELAGVNLRVQSILAFMHPVMNIILNLCVVAIIFIGGKQSGEISPGEIMAAITYMTMILHGLMFMANIFQTFTRAKASVTRINEVLACEPAVRDGDENSITTAKKGEIRFENVSFAYPDAPGRNVLENITFTVHSGETLGIIGATGSGKSSLINLIPRFYDATEGKIYIDDIEVSDYTLHALRSKIAVVLQKSELFSRSIKQNISWGRENATRLEIKTAAQTAQADDFICDTENGYYTHVTEGGHSLSGGQKQRISISRAVLKNAEIMILDDSTGALDLKTENLFYSALYGKYPKMTKIIVAQRIASIKNADKIIVLDRGRISACGSNDTLLETSDIYRDIYNSQLKEGMK